MAVHINISGYVHKLPLQLVLVWNDNYLALFHQTPVQSVQHTLAYTSTKMGNLLASHHTYQKLNTQ